MNYSGKKPVVDNVWKSGDIFILEDSDYTAKFFICEIILIYNHSVSMIDWEIKVLVPHEMPWDMIEYMLEKDNIRKVTGKAAAEFYKLFAK